MSLFTASQWDVELVRLLLGASKLVPFVLIRKASGTQQPLCSVWYITSRCTITGIPKTA
mgnify:CR=1 FL=1